jgi:hypothetical protein
MILTFSVSNAQTIGDHLNFIREKEPDGEFDYKANGGSVYKRVDGTNTLWVYFLNVDLECIAIAVHPQKPGNLQNLIELLNKDWVVIGPKNWRYYRENGSVLNAQLDQVPEVGPVIYISE